MDRAKRVLNYFGIYTMEDVGWAAAYVTILVASVFILTD